MNTKKRLISNFLSLSSVQAVNYILPLVTVPYLVRVLGPEKFGLLAFAQAFIGYFGIITDYGFGLSATRLVSINRDNGEKVSEIFSSVLLIKTALMILSFLVMCIVVFSIPKFRSEWLVYIFTFGTVLGGVLFPTWLFQGMEKMKHIAVFNIFSKAFFTICIFIFIRSQNDYYYVPFITSLGSIFVGIIAIVIIILKLNVKFKWPELTEIKYQLNEGWHIFISTIAISMYTISNTFILGLFASTTIVGYFSAGERIVRAVQGLLGPLSQTVYPHISKLAKESRSHAINVIKRLVKVIGVPTFFLSLALLIFAPQISDIVLGVQFKDSIPVIRILAFLPLIIGLSNLFAVQGLYAFGLQRIVARFVSLTAIIHLLLVFFLTQSYSYLGTATSALITETTITLLSLYFFITKVYADESTGRWAKSRI